MPGEDNGSDVEAQTEGTEQTQQADKPLTVADIEALVEKRVSERMTALADELETGQAEEADPTSAEATDKAYRDLFGPPPGTETEATPEDKKLLDMHQRILRMEKLLSQDVGNRRQQEAVKKLREEFQSEPEEEFEKTKKLAIELATGRRKVSDREFYIMAKALSHPEKLTEGQKEKAKEALAALKAGQAAQSAASHKPDSHGGETTTRTADNVRDAAEAAYEGLAAKFGPLGGQ